MRIAGALLDDEGRIRPAAWDDALASEYPVGDCHCGGPLVAAGVSVGHRLAAARVFYEVRCVLDAEHEAVIPATRVVRPPAELVGASVAGAALLEAAAARDRAILGERD